MLSFKAVVILSGGEAGARDLTAACGADDAGSSALDACSVHNLLDRSGGVQRRTVPRSAFGPPKDDIAIRDC